MKRSQEFQKTWDKGILYPWFSGTRSFTLKLFYPHQPLQTLLRCTTLRAALLVFSSFHCSIELGGDFAALRPPRSLLLSATSRSRWFAVNVCALRSLFQLLQHPRAPSRNSTRRTRA